MVRHIVVWELRPENKPRAEAIAAELGAKFRALLGVVDGLREIELGRNYNGGRYDLMLNCVFDSRGAQAAYQTHPAHMAIKAVVHGLVCARECVDCEV